MPKHNKVVEVTYDPTVVSFESLVKQAVAANVAHHVFTYTDAETK